MYELLPRFELKVKCDGADPVKEFYKHPSSVSEGLQCFWSLPRTEDPTLSTRAHNPSNKRARTFQNYTTIHYIRKNI